MALMTAGEQSYLSGAVEAGVALGEDTEAIRRGYADSAFPAMEVTRGGRLVRAARLLTSAAESVWVTVTVRDGEYAFCVGHTGRTPLRYREEAYVRAVQINRDARRGADNARRGRGN